MTRRREVKLAFKCDLNIDKAQREEERKHLRSRFREVRKYNREEEKWILRGVEEEFNGILTKVKAGCVPS